MFAYHTSVYESTGYTLYFLIFRQGVTVPVDLQISRQMELPGQTITSTLLRHSSGSTQLTNVSICKVSGNGNVRFITLISFKAPYNASERALKRSESQMVTSIVLSSLKTHFKTSFFLAWSLQKQTSDL